MSKGWPEDSEVRLWVNRKNECETKRKLWLQEREQSVKLAANEPGAWAGQTPVSGDLSGKSTLIVRNNLGMNARQEVNRLMPKEPRWNARPLAGIVEENGIEVNNEQRASKLGAVTNVVSKGSGFVDEAERCAMDGEVGNIACMLVGYLGVQGDVSHNTGVPISDEPGESTILSSQSKRMLKRPGTLHGGVTPYYPYFVRLDPTKVYLDYTAATKKEINWVIREFERPVESMRAEKVNRMTYGENGEETGVKSEFKYKIPDYIKGGSEGGKEKTLKCMEAHYRCISDEPDKHRDGMEWWILAWIEEANGNKSAPECIRHDKYGFDTGCAIKVYQANLTNDDLLGYVPAIRDSIQASRYFNSATSMMVDWGMRNKTKRVYNTKYLDKTDIDNIAMAEAEDFVPVTPKGDVPFENMIGLLPANPIPDSIPSMISMLSNLSNEGSGRSENQRGNSANTRTAAEANIVAQETSAQVLAKQKRFRKFMEECMRAGMIIFTHMIPDEGPRKGGLWEIPDPDNPGKFMQFGKKDLGADAEIEMDLLSQVLKDDTVVVSQSMQLMDVGIKILSAPPDVQRKLMPLFQRATTAMGPDWEATGNEMFRVDPDSSDPMFEMINMLGGTEVEPNPKEDLKMHLDIHRAMLTNGPREHEELWMRELGMRQNPETGAQEVITPLVLLWNHMQATIGLMQQMGLKVPGAVGGNSPGSQPGSGRAPQGVPEPSSGEVAAGAANTNVGNIPTGGE